jgi:CRISPR-associated endoribonuclease Cas6
MPAIVELRLRPERRIQPTTRQLHGLACTLFEDMVADLAGHVAQEKPFTVWPLREASDGWLLRCAWLLPGFPQSMLTSLGSVRLRQVTCAVTDMAFRTVTHEDLAVGGAADGTADTAIDGARVTFLSPAYFSQSGTRITEPDPRLIVGSWRRRWNASLPPGHPLKIDADLWRDIHLALHVTGSGLRTESRDSGYREQEGLTGTMTLRLETGASAAARSAFGALARFAEYCGTGAQVTHGFGATKTTLLRTAWSRPTSRASSAS